MKYVHAFAHCRAAAVDIPVFEVQFYIIEFFFYTVVYIKFHSRLLASGKRNFVTTPSDLLDSIEAAHSLNQFFRFACNAKEIETKS